MPSNKSGDPNSKFSTAYHFGKRKRKKVFQGRSKQHRLSQVSEESPATLSVATPKPSTSKGIVSTSTNNATPSTSVRTVTSSLNTPICKAKRTLITEDHPATLSPAKPKPSTSQTSTVTPSASTETATPACDTNTPVSNTKRRLDLFQSHSSNTPRTSSSSSYRLIDFNVIHEMVSSLVVCDDCGHSAKLTEDTVYGLASKFIVQCRQCDKLMYSSYTSSRISDTRAYDINNRFVYASKADGLGYEQSSSFLASLNLPPPISDTSYHQKLPALSQACELALKDHLAIVHDIVRQEHISAGYATEQDDVIDIAVSYDGTWQKRGHTSHNGIGVAIDVLTGYVVDFEVLSNICITCEREAPKEDEKSLRELQRYMDRHKSQCDKNYEGSSNAMEVEAAKRIWARSSAGFLRYTTMLSDGDSKAYDAVTELVPYGDTKILKEECINHVAKRLKAGLDTVRTKGGPEGFRLGGRGMLSVKLIAVLQNYYRNAIIKYAGNVDEMRREIMAAPYHITSTDDEPDHRYCPDNSWCWYKNPEKPQEHRPDLPKQMLEFILPVYERLSARPLLERCARVATQNANECVNGVIWRRCPKTQWLGRRSVSIGAAMGVMIFNSGEQELERIRTAFGLNTATKTENYAQKKDFQRKNRQLVTSSQRKSRAHRKLTERDRQIQKEGVTYAAGKFGA